MVVTAKDHTRCANGIEAIVRTGLVRATRSWKDSHIGKLTRISRWLEKTKPEHHDELVLPATNQWIRYLVSTIYSLHRTILLRKHERISHKTPLTKK